MDGMRPRHFWQHLNNLTCTASAGIFLEDTMEKMIKLGNREYAEGSTGYWINLEKHELCGKKFDCAEMEKITLPRGLWRCSMCGHIATKADFIKYPGISKNMACSKCVEACNRGRYGF